MDAFVQVLGVLAWPITVVVVVAMLRSPLSALVPTLKKLKYKELELEFEKEASKILAEAERDLPEPKRIESGEQASVEKPTVMFSLAVDEPPVEIMRSWRELELVVRDMAGSDGDRKSIGLVVKDLARSRKVSEETAKVILDLASLRNKVAHSDDEAVSAGVALAFTSTVERVKSALGNESA